MSDFRIESREERRERYMRLARAAIKAASKSPLPGAKEIYVKLAQAWVAMADEDDRRVDASCDRANTAGFGSEARWLKRQIKWDALASPHKGSGW